MPEQTIKSARPTGRWRTFADFQTGHTSPFSRENPGIRDLPDPQPPSGEFYRVVIIDNDYNTYEEVISICMLALQIDYEDAFKIALAVDHNGRAEVCSAPRDEADRIAEIIRAIGIEVLVEPEGKADS